MRHVEATCRSGENDMRRLELRVCTCMLQDAPQSVKRLSPCSSLRGSNPAASKDCPGGSGVGCSHRMSSCSTAGKAVAHVVRGSAAPALRRQLPQAGQGNSTQ